MTPYINDSDFQLWNGDSLEILKQMPSETVHCAMTSPPFYALRDYGVEGQIGLEETPEQWADALVSVFRELRRVLRRDGTLWVECGDSYNSNPSWGRGGGSTLEGRKQGQEGAPPSWRSAPNLKPKDLIGQPWLLAFALRADGWWLRQCIIWNKTNAMPESVKDRCTTAHSYVFLLSKSARYHFDADAIAEPAAWERWGDQTVPKYEGTDTASGWMQPKTKEELEAIKTKKPDGWATHEGAHGSFHRDGREKGEVAYINPGNRTTNGKKRTDEMRGFDNRLERADGMKNPRSVWTIPTKGYSGAHFATWPEALCKRIILAGCPVDGVVLDPFMGSGTTAYVARKLGRRSIGIEISEPYCQLIADRLGQQTIF